MIGALTEPGFRVLLGGGTGMWGWPRSAPEAQPLGKPPVTLASCPLWEVSAAQELPCAVLGKFRAGRSESSLVLEQRRGLSLGSAFLGLGTAESTQRHSVAKPGSCAPSSRPAPGVPNPPYGAPQQDGPWSPEALAEGQALVPPTFRCLFLSPGTRRGLWSQLVSPVFPGPSRSLGIPSLGYSKSRAEGVGQEPSP